MPSRSDVDRFHGAVTGVISRPQFKDALADLAENESARSQANSDAPGFLRAKGLQLPQNVEARVEEGSYCLTICGWGICVRFCW